MKRQLFAPQARDVYRNVQSINIAPLRGGTSSWIVPAIRVVFGR
jgi:hypothetical protein